MLISLLSRQCSPRECIVSNIRHVHQAWCTVAVFDDESSVAQGPGAYAFKGFTSIIASALILWLSFALLKFMVRSLLIHNITSMRVATRIPAGALRVFAFLST